MDEILEISDVLTALEDWVEEFNEKSKLASAAIHHSRIPTTGEEYHHLIVACPVVVECQRCHQDLPLRTADELVVITGRGESEEYGRQHGCGEWEPVEWEVIVVDEETTTDHATALVQRVMADVERKRSKISAEISAYLKGELGVAAANRPAPGADDEAIGHWYRTYIDGSEVDPGIYEYAGTLVAWVYSPFDRIGPDGEAVDTITEVEDLAVGQLVAELYALADRAEAVIGTDLMMLRVAGRGEAPKIVESLRSGGNHGAEVANKVLQLLLSPNPDGHQAPGAWWRTPLGRACAYAVGPTVAGTVTHAQAAEMLGVVRGTVAQLVDRGTLQRDAEGKILLSAVLQRIGRLDD